MAFLTKIAAVVFVPITVYIFTIISQSQSEPYMDEVFHYPQSVKYFHGKYLEWDPKITTPPGLYIITNGIMVPLAKITGLDLCQVKFFRAINTMFTLGNFYLAHQVFQKLHPKEIFDDSSLLSALNLAMLPVLYFFSFLYYTDCGSIFFVLLMYLFHLNQHQWFAAVFGAAAVLFRQTNIIWVFFLSAHPVIQVLITKFQKMKGSYTSTSKSRSSRSNDFVKKLRVKCNFYVQYWTPIIADLIYINLGYLIVGACFAAFVFVNKSLALGDKEAHKAGLNVPQLFYFLLYCLVFCMPFSVTLPNIKKSFNILMKYTFILLLVALGMALSIKYLTYEHPYTLADNRHFTFYIWKRILNRNVYLKYTLIPLYLYSGLAMAYQLKHKDMIWKLLFFLCLVVSVVPQRLLELRYFIIPLIIFRLNLKVKSVLQLICEFVLFFVVNAVTIYMFLEMPFLWENEKSLQRFMW